ncbi:glycosyltransferase family 2 protein [uncultured Algibacter sp.]|uniref:glycosyltransferase family 2 protein n=1 Tax=uncultured Algibacter sp. TaxID=298659 RepID=UPI00262E2324|nr:glycosyltransferase family 2 protein [uncultured Algibacter sp.]
MTPFFSVIIPLYNKEDYIEDTLKSVFNQSFKDFEIILIDDGSTDNSLQVVEQFNDNRLKVYTQNNQGASVARNFGIEKANSEYVALIDADDLWYEDHLQELKKLIDTFPQAGLFCNNYEINYNENFVKPATFNFDYNNECLIVEDFFKANIINFIPSSSSVTFSKKYFIDLGGYNTNFEIAEDIDLWIRFALKYKVCFNPKITMTYNIFIDNSLSKQETNEVRYKFINNYRTEEKSNQELKLYLDINRYALAIRCKINNQFNLYQKLKKEIDLKNLNLKQKLLLNSPTSILKIAKTVQRWLLRANLYLTAYK